MNRPTVARFAQTVGAKTHGIDPVTITSLIMALLPLLQACKKDPESAAGFLRGDDIAVPVGKAVRVRFREWQVRREIDRLYEGPRSSSLDVADAVVSELKTINGPTMKALYQETTPGD